MKSLLRKSRSAKIGVEDAAGRAQLVNATSCWRLAVDIEIID
jgi:hypothetical protein